MTTTIIETAVGTQTMLTGDTLYVGFVNGFVEATSGSAIRGASGFQTNLRVFIDGYAVGADIGAIDLTSSGDGTLSGTGNHYVVVGSTGTVRSFGNSSTASAITVAGSNSIVENHGQVTGFHGIFHLGPDGSILNTGSVSGQQGGIVSSGSSVSIVNSGSVVGESGIITSSNGGFISNTGTIMGRDHAMTITAPTTLNNSGTMQSGSEAVFNISFAQLNLINTGTIVGQDIFDTSFTVDVVNTGTISGRVELSSRNDVFDSSDGRVIGEILGGAGNDRILSGLNNDVIRGGIGADYMDGGVGIDTASYESDTLGVRVSLNRGKGYGPLSGEANGDTLVNIENLIGGSGNDRLFGDVNDNDIRGGSGNDFMSGQEGNDVLYGNNGSDTIFGRLGDDVIVGGAGDDVLEGGSGSDLFVFETFIASRFDGPAERDIINDYTVGVDGLDLAEVFNNSGTEMIFLGTSGFTGTNGEVRYGRNFSRNQTTVQVDTDGDSIADLVIVLKNTTAALSILDFEF